MGVVTVFLVGLRGVDNEVGELEGVRDFGFSVDVEFLVGLNFRRNGQSIDPALACI